MIMNKITSINGILLAPQNDFYQHEKNSSAHITETERTAWNAKAEASEVHAKVSRDVFDAHVENTTVHLTEQERQRWNATPELDTNGNMSLAGGLTAEGTINANGGVRVPLPATGQEAVSYEALVEQQAAQEWARSIHYLDTLVPSWVSTMIRSQQINTAYAVTTSNASIKEEIITNDLYDHAVTFTSAPGLSLLGRSTGAWKFSQYMGNYLNDGYAAAASWRVSGADQVSFMLGSTSQGYGSVTNITELCYKHPIHWADYHMAGADYRYPLDNAINKFPDRAMSTAWQVTVYGKTYLGSSTSCLVRGTHYGPGIGESTYIWALIPSIISMAVAITPPHPNEDGTDITNRWSLFIDGQYVMPMTSLYYGAGHTSCLTTKVKAHEVGNTRQLGLRMGGMRIDANPALGITNPMAIMERVVMKGAVVKPVPAAEASSLEVPAAGGDVTLTVSSTLAEAMYAINDTMCGHDPAAVWCSQSTEQILSGGGQVTLTLAPNATGAPREVWAFVGHHYGQAAVVKITQAA